ncbi:MAG: DNA-processing protein DprA [Candidatus Woesebacteria bacterium]
MDNLFLTAWVASIPGIGPKQFAILKQSFPDLGHLLKVTVPELVTIGIPEEVATEISTYKYQHHPQEIEQFCSENNVHLISSLPPLSEIPDPPIVLYVQGESPDFTKPMIAVVGTRKVTEYGKKVTWDFTTQLVKAGYMIVSSFMYGVDVIAHEATIAARGRSVAVLGYGLGAPLYPHSNEKLAEKMLKNGSCLLTEYPPWQVSLPQNFARWNRIVSGLSQEVVVTEAAAKSGSLITASQAVNQGRKVFVVSGPNDSPSGEGTKELVHMGAKLVAKVDDILAELGEK